MKGRYIRTALQPVMMTNTLTVCHVIMECFCIIELGTFPDFIIIPKCTGTVEVININVVIHIGLFLVSYYQWLWYLSLYTIHM